MAQDKTNNLTEFLKDLTSTIRTQRGWSGEINHQDISSKIQLQQKTATPSESTQTITPDSSIYGLKTVTVNAIPSDYVGSAIYNAGSEPDAKSISYWRPNDSSPYYLYAYVPNYTGGQEKALITRSLKVHSNNFGNAKQNQVLSGATFTSESGLKIAGTIETKTSLSKSGGTVTANAGYYASNVSSTVTVGDLGYSKATALGGSLSGTTYTVSIPASSYTTSKLTKDVTPGTLGLTAKAGTTITPSTTEQTAIAANYYTTGDIKVAAMPVLSITNNVSGGTSSGTITAGKQIKISAGYNSSDKYYTAQSYTYMTNSLATFAGGTDSSGIYLINSAGYVNAGTRLSKCYIEPGESLEIVQGTDSDGGSITIRSYDNDGVSYGPDVYFTNESTNETTKLASIGNIVRSSIGTSASGTLVSTITPNNNTQYVSITEGYAKAKYWKILPAGKTASISYQPYKNIIKPTVTNCQYWKGQSTAVNGMYPLFYFEGVTEAFVGSKKIPSNTYCKVGHTTTCDSSSYTTTEFDATCVNNNLYFGLNSSSTQLRVPHKGNEQGSAASYGMTLIYSAPLIFITNSNFSSTPVVTAVYSTWNRVTGIMTVGGTYCANMALTEKITDTVSSNKFFYPGYISMYGLDGNNTLQIAVDSNTGTLS